jgi:integrase
LQLELACFLAFGFAPFALCPADFGSGAGIEPDQWLCFLASRDHQRPELFRGRVLFRENSGQCRLQISGRFTGLFLGIAELTPRSFTEYHEACMRVLNEFGCTRAVDDLRTDDFEKLRAKMARQYGPWRLTGEVQRIRSLFKYAFDAGHTEKMMRFGSGFKKPSKRQMRVHKAAAGKKLFRRDEVRAMVCGAVVVGKDGPELVRANLQLRAMILLGINCGFGNDDWGTLPLSALDLDGGWIDFPRPKTGINRRCPLWSETVAGLREVLDARPAPKEPEAEGRLFVTKYGKSWSKAAELTVKDGIPSASRANPVSAEMRQLLNALGINGSRNFYTLQHTFETVGGGSRD